MVLYTLKNATFQLDVFEDRLIFRPNLVMKVMGGKAWSTPVTVPYGRVHKVELQQHLWPLRHDLTIHTTDQIYHFRFHQPLPFYQRLAPYIERQATKYRNHPESFPTPVKTVIDLVEEKRKKALKEFMRAA